MNDSLIVSKKKKFNKQQVFKDALKHWGADLQAGMLNEEMVELTIAVNKYRRNPSPLNKEHIEEEIADVLLMIDQIKHMLNLSDKVIEDYYARKLVKVYMMIEANKK